MKKRLRKRSEVLSRKDKPAKKLPVYNTLRKFIELEKVYKYTEFCDLLCVKRCLRKNRPSQVEDWSKYLDIEYLEEDDSLIVHRIKAYVPLDTSVGAFPPNAVYPPLIYSILTRNMTRGSSITMTKKQLLKMFRFIKNEPDIPDEIKRSKEYIQIKNFYYLKVSSIVDSALQSLVRHGFITLSKDRYIFKKKQGEMKGDNLHDEISTDVEKTVRYTTDVDEVYESGQTYIKKYTSWDRAYYKYTITLVHKMRPKIDEDSDQLYEKAKEIMSSITDNAKIASFFV